MGIKQGTIINRSVINHKSLENNLNIFRIYRNADSFKWNYKICSGRSR